MKKTLLFIGLALCASFAFAQTNNYNKKAKATGLDNMTVSMKVSDMKTVDYKASIFSKDAGDIIADWNFTGAADDMPTVYGTDGRVGSGMFVNGSPLPANTITATQAGTWQYVPDSNFFHSTFYQNNYPDLPASFRTYMMEDLGDSATGYGHFMLMSMYDFTTPQGFPNAYMSFAPHANPAGTEVVRVYIKQEYMKYYDQCWIDYKIGNTWKTREVNVTGIDLGVNDWGAVETEYSMPLELANESNIEIRIRYSGTTRTTRVHGYFWAIGQVTIKVGKPYNWQGYRQEYVDGAYGTIPQNMSIPLTWTAQVSNTGAHDITGIQTKISHILNGDTTEIASQNVPNIAINNMGYAYINERGFINPNNTDAFESAGWYLYAINGAYGSANLPNGYHGNGMNTATLGQNKIQASVVAGTNDPLYWPAIPYRVVGNTYAPLNENLLLGYRWGHDNGIIPSGRTSAIVTNPVLADASYVLGKVLESDGEFYISDEGSYNQPGYTLTLRYTTPNTIPTDDDGNPWVIRGIELVTSSMFSGTNLNGTSLIPLLYKDVYNQEDSTVNFTTVNTGINGYAVTFSGTELTNELETHYIVANEDGDYNAASFFFPEQPALTPSTSFRIGYQLAEQCEFAVAATRSTVIEPAVSGTGYRWMPIDSTEDENVRGYGRNFTPNTYDVTVTDPIEPGNIWAGYYNNGTFPFIRAIIGPRIPLPTYSIYVDCEDGQSKMSYVNEDVCGTEVIVTEGGSPTIYIFGGDDHAVLTHLYIDGEEVFPNTDDFLDGDPNFYTEGDDSVVDSVDADQDGVFDSLHVYLQRNYWAYTFENIDTSHSIRATSEYAEYTEFDVAVDPVNADVRMRLAPNPATSQVVLVLRGVTGMVNCSILDMSGRVVYTSTLNAEHTNSIDLSNVPAGAYFVRINNDSFVKVEKLIVR